MAKRRCLVLLLAFVAGMVPVHPASAAGATLTFSVDALRFFDQRVGTSSATKRFTATASGGAVEVRDIVYSEGNGFDDFPVVDSDCEGTLAAGESCFVDVAFAPTDRSARSIRIGFDSDADNDPHVDAFGTGTVGYFMFNSAGEPAWFGDAANHGGMSADRLNAPVVGAAATPSGNGYWLVAADGGVFTFGDAGFHGSQGGKPLNRAVVGMAATPTGNGYWLVAADGGIFTFGDAAFHASLGGKPLNAPVVGMAATPSGGGYWLVAADGGIFTFGDAGFHGSMGGQALSRPVVGMAGFPNGNGYWLVARDGHIFGFGRASFLGDVANTGVTNVVAMAGTASPVSP